MFCFGAFQQKQENVIGFDWSICTHQNAREYGRARKIGVCCSRKGITKGVGLVVWVGVSWLWDEAAEGKEKTKKKGRTETRGERREQTDWISKLMTFVTTFLPCLFPNFVQKAPHEICHGFNFFYVFPALCFQTVWSTGMKHCKNEIVRVIVSSLFCVMVLARFSIS